MEVSGEVIVLHVLKYSDDANIAEVLSREYGRMSFFVRISQSRKAFLKCSLFQPMAQLRLTWNGNGKSQMQRAKLAHTSVMYNSIPYTPDKIAIAMFVAEFLRHAIRGTEDVRSVFDYTASSMQWLDACEGGYANFHLAYLLKLSLFLGFSPDTRNYSPGMYFDLSNSCFTHEKPSGSDFLEPSDAASLPTLMRMSYPTMRFFKFTHEQRTRLLKFMNEYYSIHLPGFPDMKSLDVLGEVFS